MQVGVAQVRSIAFEVFERCFPCIQFGCEGVEGFFIKRFVHVPLGQFRARCIKDALRVGRGFRAPAGFDAFLLWCAAADNVDGEGDIFARFGEGLRPDPSFGVEFFRGSSEAYLAFFQMHSSFLFRRIILQWFPIWFGKVMRVACRRVFADVGADDLHHADMVAAFVIGGAVLFDAFEREEAADSDFYIGAGFFDTVALDRFFRAQVLHGLGDAVGHVTLFGYAGLAFGGPDADQGEWGGDEGTQRGDQADEGEHVPAQFLAKRYWIEGCYDGDDGGQDEGEERYAHQGQYPCQYAQPGEGFRLRFGHL